MICISSSRGGAIQVVEGTYPSSVQTHELVVIAETTNQIMPRVYFPPIVYSGCRMSFYEYIRENIFKRNKDGKYPLW